MGVYVLDSPMFVCVLILERSATGITKYGTHPNQMYDFILHHNVKFVASFFVWFVAPIELVINIGIRVNYVVPCLSALIGSEPARE